MTTLDRHERKAVTYGELLREARKAGGKTMGELAQHLNVAVSKLSDVELGICGPFGRVETAEAAAFIGCDPDPLHLAANAHWAVVLRGTSAPVPATQVPQPSVGRVVLYAIGQDRAGNIVWRPATVTSVNTDRKGTPNLRVILEPDDGPTYLAHNIEERVHNLAPVFRANVRHVDDRSEDSNEIACWKWPPRV